MKVASVILKRKCNSFVAQSNATYSEHLFLDSVQMIMCEICGDIITFVKVS